MNINKFNIKMNSTEDLLDFLTNVGHEIDFFLNFQTDNEQRCNKNELIISPFYVHHQNEEPVNYSTTANPQNNSNCNQQVTMTQTSNWDEQNSYETCPDCSLTVNSQFYMPQQQLQQQPQQPQQYYHYIDKTQTSLQQMNDCNWFYHMRAIQADYK